MHTVFNMNGRLYRLELLQGLWPFMFCFNSLDIFPRSRKRYQQFRSKLFLNSGMFYSCLLSFLRQRLKTSLEFPPTHGHRVPVPVPRISGRYVPWILTPSGISGSADGGSAVNLVRGPLNSGAVPRPSSRSGFGESFFILNCWTARLFPVQGDCMLLQDEGNLDSCTPAHVETYVLLVARGRTLQPGRL